MREGMKEGERGEETRWGKRLKGGNERGRKREEREKGRKGDRR